MSNTLEIVNLEILKNRISVKFKASGEIKNYFLGEEFYVEYSSSIENIGPQIGIIPFICNVLPIVWISDAVFVVDNLDLDFYECIIAVKKGYIDMYPDIDFAGEFIAKELIKSQPFTEENCLCLFSGGVDSTYTLTNHLDKNPDLASIWGADVELCNFEGWKNVKAILEGVASLYRLKFEMISSNMRTIIDEVKLTQRTFPLSGSNWWAGIQHSIAMLGLMAPYTFQHRISTIYIAATYSTADIGKFFCASDPTIDNFLKFCGCSIVHDGYDYNRQEKLREIIRTSARIELYPYLRVCYTSDSGDNCCVCEKCIRTILGIYAEREEPKKFGFDKYMDNYVELSYKVKYVARTLAPKMYKCHYPIIQKSLRENYDYLEIPKCLRWFYVTDIENDKINSCFVFMIRYIMRILRKTKRTYLIIMQNIRKDLET